MADRINVILLGPPGAGKGTQAKLLAYSCGLEHLSSGDLLRTERAAGSQLGEKVAGYMDQGSLVPDDLVTQVVLDAVSERLRRGAKGVLLDGFPRTIAQAGELDRAIGAMDQSITAVINLKLPDDVVVSRLTGRRSCPECGQVFHITTKRPQRDGICDDCAAALVQRSDDTEEVVRQRLAVYRRETQPLEHYYQRSGLLREVDASMQIEQIAEQIEKAVHPCCFEK